MLSVGDISAGARGAAVYATLLNRTPTGKGQWLDISLVDCYHHNHEINMHIGSASGGAVVPKRSGGPHYDVCPLGAFKGAFKGANRYRMLMCCTFGTHSREPLCRPMGRDRIWRRPYLGDRNEETLRDHLAPNAQEVAALTAAGILAQRDNRACATIAALNCFQSMVKDNNDTETCS